MTKEPSQDIHAEIPVKAQTRDLTEAGRILEQWLTRKLDHVTDLSVIRVKIPGGAGVANETLLLDTRQIVDGTTIDVPYVVRVNCSEHLFMDLDLRVHYKMYELLSSETDIPVPEVLGFEEDRSLLGDRFFLMQRVAGQVPPDDPPFHQAGWVTQLSTEERHAMWRNAVEVMARLHAVDPEALPILKRPHLGRSGLEQELRHWLTYAKWCGGDQHSIIAASGKWLVDNFPNDPPTSLSWGDSRVGNMIFRGSEVVAVLDWDMVSLAGPEADLAWYMIMDQAATVSQGVPRLPGFGTPRDTVDLWEALSGRKARNLDWHAVFTSYRMGVIMIRLATMLKSQGRLAPESLYLLTNNIGIQWLSELLNLPPAGPITTPWLGWDR